MKIPAMLCVDGARDAEHAAKILLEQYEHWLKGKYALGRRIQSPEFQTTLTCNALTGAYSAILTVTYEEQQPRTPGEAPLMSEHDRALELHKV